MAYDSRKAAIECMLFVAGDPVPLGELQRVLDLMGEELLPLLQEMEREYREEERGIRLSLTGETAQLCSSRALSAYVEELMQPAESRTFSQSLLETLAVVAYRQPVTRADIEAVRGVRCEYAVTQLIKLNMIAPMGRKDAVGRPMLYGTTDAFLRQFNLGSVEALPNFAAYQKGELPGEEGETLEV